MQPQPRIALPSRVSRLPLPVLIAALAAINACKDGVSLFEPPPPASAHERYAKGLERAGLEETALGRDWMAAARSSIRQPLSVSLPFREAGYFAATEARAVGYAIKLRDGQRLSVTAETNGSDGAPLTIFLDLYRQTGDTANPLDLVASTDTAARLVHEARRDGVYVLRVQPELLRSGDYNVTASTEPSLAFPVSGRDGRAVKSFFGADRDAGARRHHGIDIFAPRGTPVLAAARGVVRSISPNNLGGNVVWLSDHDRGQTLYYAHLDRHNVTAGQQVEIGDTLGFVGTRATRAAPRRICISASTDAGRGRSTRIRSCTARMPGRPRSSPTRRRSVPLAGLERRLRCWHRWTASRRCSRPSTRERRYRSMAPREAGFECGCRTGPPGTSPHGWSNPHGRLCGTQPFRRAHRSAIGRLPTRASSRPRLAARSR